MATSWDTRDILFAYHLRIEISVTDVFGIVVSENIFQILYIRIAL